MERNPILILQSCHKQCAIIDHVQNVPRPLSSKNNVPTIRLRDIAQQNQILTNEGFHELQVGFHILLF